MSAPEVQPVSAYKTPKNTLLVVTKAGIAKGLLMWWQTLALAVHAGCFLGAAGGLTIAIAGALDGSAGMKKLVTGALFPVGLILIVFAGAELFTGNVMYMLAAKMGGQTKWVNVFRNWLIVYFGNLCGALLTAYFMFDQTRLFNAANYKAYIATLGHSKVYHGNFGTYFLKGIGCNYLVCLSLWMACACDDSVSKVVALWWPLMTFVCIGFEHSIANMFYVSLAIMNGAPITTNDFIVNNLIPVTIGNWVGGALFIAVQFLIYHPYATTAISNMKVVQGGKTDESPASEKVDGKHIVPGHEDTIFANLVRRFRNEPAKAPTAKAVEGVQVVDTAQDHHDIELAQK